MAKGKDPQVYGATVEEVDGNIAAMNAEREELAKKQGTKDFDNKRFEELTNNLVVANNQRAGLSPADTGAPVTFNEQITTVPPIQTGEASTTVTNFAVPPGGSGFGQPQTGSLLGEMNPGGTEVMGLDGQGGLPVNDISQLGQPGAASSIPIDQPQSMLGNGGFLQNFLSSVDRSKTDGVESAINKSMFGQPGSYKPQPLVDISAGDLFFGAGEPILKGNVSGQIIGNQPIFVGGSDYFPAQVLNRRQKAIQDAAVAQKQAEQEFLNQRAPLIKDKGFQRNLNDRFNTEFNTMVDQAKELYGDQWLSAIQDQSTPVGRSFVNFSDNMNFLAGSADQATDLIAETKKNLESADLAYSPETIQLLQDYENLQGDFAGGNVETLANLRQEFGKLQGHIGIDKVLNDQGIDVKGTVTQYASVVDKGDYYETTEQKKTAYEDQLRVLAKDFISPGGQLYSGAASGLFTEEDVFNHLNALYGYEKITNKSVTNKPAGSGGIVINLDQKAFEGNKQELIGEQTYNAVYSRELPTNLKPMEVSGLTYYNADGTQGRQEGVVNVNPNALQVVKVETKDPKTGAITYEYKKGVVATYQEPIKDENGQPTQQTKTVTRIYSYDDMIPRFKADNPNQADQFDAVNQEMNSSIEKNQGNKTQYERALEQGFE